LHLACPAQLGQPLSPCWTASRYWKFCAHGVNHLTDILFANSCKTWEGSREEDCDLLIKVLMAKQTQKMLNYAKQA
jgi:hypothetical protein